MTKKFKNRLEETIVVFILCTTTILIVEYVQFLQRIIDSK